MFGKHEMPIDSSDSESMGLVFACELVISHMILAEPWAPIAGRFVG